VSNFFNVRGSRNKLPKGWVKDTIVGIHSANPLFLRKINLTEVQEASFEGKVAAGVMATEEDINAIKTMRDTLAAKVPLSAQADPDLENETEIKIVTEIKTAIGIEIGTETEIETEVEQKIETEIVLEIEIRKEIFQVLRVDMVTLRTEI
jgi:hypothetical protein